jgi:hypothetical protein
MASLLLFFFFFFFLSNFKRFGPDDLSGWAGSAGLGVC